jgi:1-acyl-sn-glycerol-3-phosphate acyltransferase
MNKLTTRPDGSDAQAGDEMVHLQQGVASTARWYIKAFRLLIRGLFRVFFRIRVVGLENVPSTPCIVCANHLGWTDPFIVLLFSPVEPRIYILGEREVKQISTFRTTVINRLQIMVDLDRNKPREALRIMEDVLKRGGSLLIFPEGRLGKEEGVLQELQNGAAHLSVYAGVPLLPVGLTGTSELWLRRRLVMRIGGPIDPANFEGDMRTRIRAMTERLHHNMAALLPGDRDRTKVKLLRKWLTNLF